MLYYIDTSLLAGTYITARGACYASMQEYPTTCNSNWCWHTTEFAHHDSRNRCFKMCGTVLVNAVVHQQKCWWMVSSSGVRVTFCMVVVIR